MNKIKKYCLLLPLALFATVLCALCLVACGKDSECETLTTPQNLRIVDEVLQWDAVKDAVVYDVEIDDKVYETEAAELDVFLITCVPKTYAMRVRAASSVKNKNDSDWSESIEYRVDIQKGWGLRLINNDKEYEIGAVDKSAMVGKFVIPERCPDGKPITQIANQAFKDCTELTSVIIPNTVKNIGFAAFYGCKNLTTVRMPPYVTEISDSAFLGCESLKNINLPDDLEKICMSAFEGCKSLAEISLPNGVKTIRSSAFSDCIALKEIAFSDRLESLEICAFSNCDSLSSISVDELNPEYKSDGNCLVRASDNRLVLGCKTSAIPDYVRVIDKYAFLQCNGLTEITIPQNVEEIEKFAFFQCASLKKVVVESGVKIIKSSAFSLCSFLEEVVLPDTLTDTQSNPFVACNALKKITVDANNPVFKSDGNCIIRKEDNRLVVGCMASEIPDYVESIGNGAFENLNITHITVKTKSAENREEGVLELPSGLKYIGSAFVQCKKLTTVQLPDELQQISDNAFMDCANLGTIIITDKSKLSFDKDPSFGSATVYTSFNELPDSWYKDGNRENGLVVRCQIVKNCVFGEDNGRLYVDSFVIGEDVKDHIRYLSYPIVSPYRKGYSFVGWAKDSRDGEMMALVETQNKSSFSGKESDKFTAMPAIELKGLPVNTTLYAVWKPVEQ